MVTDMILEGKKGLILNVSNKFSIGWNIAEAVVQHGGTLGLGTQTEKIKTSMGRQLAEVGWQDSVNLHLLDFQDDAQLDSLVEQVELQYGKLDFLVHSAAFAQREDLMGKFIKTSREGFKTALEISCYSFIRMCQAFEPVLADDASVMTLSYLGSVRACANYNVMGVAKAALESSVRYLSQDLGERGIRVNAISPGPINTAAARGIAGLGDKIDHVSEVAPLKRDYAKAVGGTAVYLMSDLGRGVSGQVIYVDSGYSIVAL